MPLTLGINDEVSKLETVILGLAEDMAGPGEHNPKSRFHLEYGTYPRQKDIQEQIQALEHVLIENGIRVFRPQNIKNLTQLFTRDLAFVIGNKIFISRLSDMRRNELEGINYLLDLVPPSNIIDLSEKDMQIEGGDVVLKEDKIFVGISERTNKKGAQFLAEYFKDQKKVIEVQLVTNEEDHRFHALHLDCAFQPLGEKYAIIYENVMKNPEVLYKSLGLPEENYFKTSEWQFVNMFTNVLSISRDTVIIEKEFIELKYWLLERGFNVIEIPFREVCKLSGLLRCSTLPLFRA